MQTSQNKRKRWQRVAAGLAAVLAMVLGVAVVSTPATAALPPGGTWSPYYYYLVAEHSGKCLDVQDRATYHGADVIQGNCNTDLATNANQLWRIYYPGHVDGFAYYVARHSGMCLDVAYASTAHGADVVQGTCGGPGAGGNQRWRRVTVSSPVFTLRPEHVYPYMCLDVAYASTAHGADVVQGTCGGAGAGANQHWRLYLAAPA